MRPEKPGNTAIDYDAPDMMVSEPASQYQPWLVSIGDVTAEYGATARFWPAPYHRIFTVSYVGRPHVGGRSRHG